MSNNIKIRRSESSFEPSLTLDTIAHLGAGGYQGSDLPLHSLKPFSNKSYQSSILGDLETSSPAFLDQLTSPNLQNKILALENELREQAKKVKAAESGKQAEELRKFQLKCAELEAERDLKYLFDKVSSKAHEKLQSNEAFLNHASSEKSVSPYSCLLRPKTHKQLWCSLL